LGRDFWQDIKKVFQESNMAKRATKVTWTEEQEQRLVALVEEGATPTRAAASLKRNIMAVRNKARSLGKPFPLLKDVRKRWAAEPGKKNSMFRPF
jgi:serine/threonine-protein kinase RIO1